MPRLALCFPAVTSAVVTNGDWGSVLASRALSVVSMLAGTAAASCGAVIRILRGGGAVGRYWFPLLLTSLAALVCGVVCTAVFCSISRAFTAGM